MKHSSFQCQREAARGSHEMLVNSRAASDQPCTITAVGGCGHGVCSSSSFPNEPGNWDFDFMSHDFLVLAQNCLHFCERKHE